MNITSQICEALKRTRLLDDLKALPYANEIGVFGSVVRGTNPYPNDIDLLIDLRGRKDADQHPCFDDIPLLNTLYSPPSLIDFWVAMDDCTRKLALLPTRDIFEWEWRFISLPAFVGACGFVDRPTVPLLSVKRWGSAEIFNLM
jgi:predicted nucleotidyltransferase